MKPAEIEAKIDRKIIENIRLSFLEKTGYSRDDLLAMNPRTRQFATRNGGVYHFPVSGGIIHIKGPSPDPEERYD